MSADSIQVHVFADGRVQGVGYREFVRRSAERFGVTGWVRNRRDGSVEARLRGPPDKVESVVAEMRRGPRFAEVANLRVGAPQPDDDAGAGFAVLNTN